MFVEAFGISQKTTIRDLEEFFNKFLDESEYSLVGRSLSLREILTKIDSLH